MFISVLPGDLTRVAEVPRYGDFSVFLSLFALLDHLNLRTHIFTSMLYYLVVLAVPHKDRLRRPGWFQAIKVGGL